MKEYIVYPEVRKIIIRYIYKVPVECFSRVAGYFRPVDQWNKGKREEFSERKFYDPNKKA